MGKIVVFTADEDINSQKVLLALNQRNLPYERVSLTQRPSIYKQVKGLSCDSGLPQTFFNTRYVGGVEKVLEELTQWWDSDPSYPSARARYEKLIAATGNPQNLTALVLQPSLTAISDKPSVVVEDPTSISLHLKPSRKVPLVIDLPDGTKTSVWDVTEKLKNTLWKTELQLKNIHYKNCCSGYSAAKTFQKSMDLSLEEALKFGERLVQAKILHPLGGGGGTCQFSDSVNSIYRLQCFMTPNVLNTYRLWDEPGAATTDEVMDLLTRLNQMLSNAEMESLDTQTGQLDHAKARLHPSFASFEEAICEFQVVHLASCNMDHDTSLAFGINLYKVMLRYALLKIGIPTSEANRLHYMKHVQFDIGGQVFSFQDWVDGILRGNRKATYHARTPFGPLDSRRK